MPAGLSDGPVVALTTSGWDVVESLDMNRVREFGAGVLAVRASMTGLPGLRSQQSFLFPGVLECDPITVTSSDPRSPPTVVQIADRRRQPVSSRCRSGSRFGSPGCHCRNSASVEPEAALLRIDNSDRRPSVAALL